MRFSRQNLVTGVAGMVLGLVVGGSAVAVHAATAEHPTTESPATKACAKAAFWADDWVHTGDWQPRYEKAVRRCARLTGGF
jgi:disulfide bond formation protein DsbB